MITKSRLCEKPVFCWKKPPQSGGCGPHEEVRTPSRQNRNLMHYPIMLRAEIIIILYHKDMYSSSKKYRLSNLYILCTCVNDVRLKKQKNNREIEMRNVLLERGAEPRTETKHFTAPITPVQLLILPFSAKVISNLKQPLGYCLNASDNASSV